MFFSSGPVLCSITAAQGAPPIPFSLRDTVLSLWESVTSEISDFVLSHLYSVFSPFLCLLHFTGLNVFIFSYCRDGGRRTVQLHEGRWLCRDGRGWSAPGAAPAPQPGLHGQAPCLPPALHSPRDSRAARAFLDKTWQSSVPVCSGLLFWTTQSSGLRFDSLWCPCLVYSLR